MAGGNAGTADAYRRSSKVFPPWLPFRPQGRADRRYVALTKTKKKRKTKNSWTGKGSAHARPHSAGTPRRVQTGGPTARNKAEKRKRTMEQAPTHAHSHIHTWPMAVPTAGSRPVRWAPLSRTTRPGPEGKKKKKRTHAHRYTHTQKTTMRQINRGSRATSRVEPTTKAPGTTPKLLMGAFAQKHPRSGHGDSAHVRGGRVHPPEAPGAA